MSPLLRRSSVFKISHRRHTGRLRSHEYTSYLPLMLLLVLTGIILVVDSTLAANPPPQEGSVSLSGTMPGHAPKTGAVITSPVDQSHFSDTPITVKGTCPNDTLVEIFENDIFAGSTPCKDGKFSLKIGLLFGKNKLVARVFNAVNQEGPKSNIVNAIYNPVTSQGAPLSPMDFSNQLILNTSVVYRGVFPGQSLNVPISIIGGTPPYAVNIQWGDLKNSVVSRSNDETFSVDHTYQKAGTYQLTLQATDAKDRVAFLTVAVIINGQPPVTASTKNDSGGTSSKLMELWPLYTASVAVVVSFWLGERREKRVLAEHPALNLHLQH